MRIPSNFLKFIFLSRNSQRADKYFKIPPSKVVEIGQQIEL